MPTKTTAKQRVLPVNLIKMKKLSFLLCLAAMSALALTACKKKPQPGYSTFKLDQVFDLKMNGSAQLEGGDLKLSFSGVPEDSRCPKGVNCIREGDIKITLAAATGSQNKTLEFIRSASQTGNVTQSFENYKIQWLDVSPYPEKDKTIRKEDYKIRIAVRQAK
jgi:hypothetical protein